MGVYVADGGGKTGVLLRDAGLEFWPRQAVAKFRVISPTLLIVWEKCGFTKSYSTYEGGK